MSGRRQWFVQVGPVRMGRYILTELLSAVYSYASDYSILCSTRLLGRQR